MKTLSKIGTKREFPQPEGQLWKAVAFIIFNGDRLNILSSRSGIRPKCTFTSIKNHTGGPRWCKKKRW